MDLNFVLDSSSSFETKKMVLIKGNLKSIFVSPSDDVVCTGASHTVTRDYPGRKQLCSLQGFKLPFENAISV